MGFVMDFDPTNNILRLTVEGRLTGAMLHGGYEAVTRYVVSHSPSRGILDLSRVTEVEVSSDAIRQLTKLPPAFPTGYMRIVVAPRLFVYALCRMFQILGEETRPDLHVVRSTGEAYRLLCVQSAEFVPVTWAKTG
jgi:hypothetical protein